MPIGVLIFIFMRFIPDLKVWAFSLGFHKNVVQSLPNDFTNLTDFFELDNPL